MGRIIKYNLAKGDSIGERTKSVTFISGGGTTYNNTEGDDKQLKVNCQLWGQDFDGGDIDGTMTVYGDIYLKNPAGIDADEEDDEEEEEEEEGTTPTPDDDDDDEEVGVGRFEADDDIVSHKTVKGKDGEFEQDLTVGRHLYIHSTHPAHSGEKKCVGEIVNALDTRVTTNTTNIASLTARVTTNETNIQTNADDIAELSDSLGDEIDRAKKAEKQLDDRVTVLEQRKQAGYYWSSGVDGDQPTEPIEYVGADIGDFEISPERPYLWRTTDGTTWSLAQKWIEPEPAKYYVACTHLACYVHGDNTRYYYPGGFVCFTTDFVNKPFGVANWTTPVTGFQSQGATAPSLSYPSAMQSTKAGKIPNVTGYPYIFRVDDISQVNNYMKWALVQSGSSSGGTFEHVIPYDDWGSGTTAPGYLMWVVNRSNNQIADQHLGANPSTDPFITADGTSDKWNNAKWRKSFLQHILSGFLYQNRSFYNENVNGWSFSYNGVISSTGYGGQWTGRMAGVQPPTSNDPSDIGYYYAASIAYLSGYVYGRSSGCPFRVDFIFRNVTLGARLPYRQLPASVGGTIDKTGTAEKVWNCDYGECIYKVTNN